MVIGLTLSFSAFSQNIGTKWTYEAKNHPAAYVGFEEYIIVDTILWKGEHVAVVEPGLLDKQDYMLVKDEKVYFWDEQLQDYQLNYDFNNDSSYYIQYFDDGGNQVDSALVHVDSIITEEINGVDHSIQYCRSKLGFSNIARPFRVIKHVGSDYAGVRLPLGFILDNITNDIQRIRCYETIDIQYIFTDVSCDSTWLKTDVPVLESAKISIYPNPTSGYVRIDGLEGESQYELYSLDSRLLQKGQTIDQSLIIEPAGMSLLRIEVGDRWIWKRVVKLE